MEEAVKKFTVIEEKSAEIFINGENTMSVGNIDQFKGNRGSALHGIKVFAGRTEKAVAVERDEFLFATVRAAIHGTGSIAAVDHFIHVFNDRSTFM